ncbi:MAG: FAD-dependent oxidoreductase [Bacteroidetes bacterium]|nr:FAD-dependent oxidoreductase [Bacteroidota bacterium]MBS1930323.1 FAD-dependent oxidoreductase [Bacteroidota bacterium]
MKVTVIGGGVIGLCSAYYLQKEGHEVTVIEKNDITDGCSFGNMGYVSPSHFTPIATPGIVAQGLRWMLKSSSPFYIKPRLNWDLIRWGMTFWKNANAKKVEQNIPHLNNLLQLSRHLMSDIKSDLNDSFPMIEKGIWMLYKSEKTAIHEKHLAEQAHHLGLKTIMCTPQEVQKYEPEVEVNIAGGVLYTDDCHIDSGSFMRKMYQWLQNDGVKFWVNTEVTGFEKNNSRVTAIITDKTKMDCEKLIIANGSWLGKISKLLSIYIPMQPGKGYSLSYDDLEKNLHYPSILVDDRTATTPIDRWLRIGGTMELSGHSGNILPKRVAAIYNAFKKYYPSMNLPVLQTQKAWFGYRPVSPDGMPYIGKHNKFTNLIYAGGHAMLGVSAAAGTGHLIEQLIDDKPTSIDISAFDPLRFS